MNKKLALLLLLISVGLLTALAVGSVFAGNHGENGLDKAKEAKEKHVNQLLAIEGVVGVGVGFTDDGATAVVVYTTRPEVVVPEKLDDVRVKRVVSGLIVARCDYKTHTTDKCRPAPIGVSTGHPDITAGTIGARVVDDTGNTFALSNNHVYANINEATTGEAVIQPGDFDGGVSPTDNIGTLSAFVPIVFSYQDCDPTLPDDNCNTIDAAIASATTDDLGYATMEGGYGTPSSIPVAASLTQAVQKCGRTTYCTQGTVTVINLDVDVCYKARGLFMCNNNYIARFVDQIGIEGTPNPGDFSAGGDSGSLIVSNDGDNNPVGLLFAGSSALTIANHIDQVLAEFGVTVDNCGGCGGGGNTAPTITSTPVTTATEGVLYTYDVDATDDDGDTLTYSLDAAPLGMTISATGLIEWTPGATDAGDHSVTVRVEDGRGGAATQSYTITVQEDVNVNPVITSTPVTTATVGQLYTYDVDATDDDGDTLAYSLDAAPLGMTISATGLIEWTPGATDAGDHPVTARVEDGRGGAATQSYTVTVTESTGIALSATGYKVRGLQKADLVWTEATSTNVAVYRDGSLIAASTLNDGFYTDNIDQRGGGSYTYEVCEQGTDTCSNEATVTFN